MDAILFDLYGTLIDIRTDESKDSFWKKFANETKIYKEYDYLKLKEKYLYLCKHYEKFSEEIELLEVFKDLFFADETTARRIALIFRRLSRKYYRLYFGAKKLLKKLKKNYKIYLLSNAQSCFTIDEMTKLGIYTLFDGIAISSDYKIKKPNEEFFKAAIKDFNINDQITMIGNDYNCDILPAKNIGLKTIYIETRISPGKVECEKIKGFNWRKIYRKIINE